jgi:hypothetical protein
MNSLQTLVTKMTPSVMQDAKETACVNKEVQMRGSASIIDLNTITRRVRVRC